MAKPSSRIVSTADAFTSMTFESVQFWVKTAMFRVLTAVASCQRELPPPLPPKKYLQQSAVSSSPQIDLDQRIHDVASVPPSLLSPLLCTSGDSTQHSISGHLSRGPSSMLPGPGRRPLHWPGNYPYRGFHSWVCPASQTSHTFPPNVAVPWVNLKSGCAGLQLFFDRAFPYEPGAGCIKKWLKLTMIKCKRHPIRSAYSRLNHYLTTK